MQPTTEIRPLSTYQAIRTIDDVWAGKPVTEERKVQLRRFLADHIADAGINRRVRLDCTESTGRDHMREWTYPTLDVETLLGAFDKARPCINIIRKQLMLQSAVDRVRNLPFNDGLMKLSQELAWIFPNEIGLRSRLQLIITQEANPPIPDGLDPASVSLLGSLLATNSYESLVLKLDNALRQETIEELKSLLLQEAEGTSLFSFEEFTALYWWGDSAPGLLTPSAQARWMHGNHYLDGLKNANQVALQLWMAISTLWEKSVKGHYKPGDILLRDTQLRDRFYSTKGNCAFAVARPFVRRFDHAALIGENNAGQPTAYEVFIGKPPTLYGRLEPKRILDKVYRLQLCKLMSDASRDKLAQAWGLDWQDILQDRFSQAHKRVQSGLNKRECGPDYRTQSTVNSSRAIQARLLPFGTLRIPETDFQGIHAEIVAKHGDKAPEIKNVLCSEFVANITIASVAELNLMLSLEFPDEPHGMISMPFPAHRNLSTLLPERLLSDLEQADLLEEIKPPHPLRQLISMS